MPVEMPVAAAAPPIAESTIAPAVQEPRLTNDVPQAAPVEVAPITSSEPVAVPAVEAPVAVDADTGEVRYTADTPVDEICALTTLDEARNIIVDVGTYKGQTLAWVSERRAASLKWYLNGYQGDNNMLRAGAKLLLESLAMDKAS